MIKIALICTTKSISASELNAAASAFQKQVTRNFGPIWKVDASIKIFKFARDVPRDYWPVTIRDRIKAEGAVSYHSVNKDRPFVEVSYRMATESGIHWTSSASHDLLEMLADPYVNRTVKAPPIVTGKNYDVFYPIQVCDPCAGMSYMIDGVTVSDFSTPEYWNPGSKKKGRYSYTGALTRPFQVLPGGYLNWQDPKTKKWNFYLGETKAGSRDTDRATREGVARTTAKGRVRFQNPALAKFYEERAVQRQSIESVVRELISRFQSSRDQNESWTKLPAKNLDDLYAILNSLSDTQAYVFRGQASAKWHCLQPSLHRSLGETVDLENSVMTEAMAIRAFRRHARSLLHPSELIYFDRILDSITLMQHYGAPTRLLDWTLSPWVACYFAVQGEDKNDAAIWAFNSDELLKYNHQHFRSSSYQSFGKLESAQSVEDWASAARDSGPYVKVFRYEYANPQMSAQQSLFTISGRLGDNHDAALERSLPEPWHRLKIIISRKDKDQLRRRLFTMNVSPLALFPTPDGVGRNIREAMQSKLSLGDESLLWSLDERTATARRRKS